MTDWPEGRRTWAGRAAERPNGRGRRAQRATKRATKRAKNSRQKCSLPRRFAARAGPGCVRACVSAARAWSLAAARTRRRASKGPWAGRIRAGIQTLAAPCNSSGSPRSRQGPFGLHTSLRWWRQEPGRPWKYGTEGMRSTRARATSRSAASAPGRPPENKRKERKAERMREKGT